MNSHAAGSASDKKPTLAQFGELCRQAERGDVTRNRFQNFLRGGKTFDGNAVLNILGYDIIFPEDVMNARPEIEYRDEQLKRLTKAFPDATELQWLKENNYVIMPLPPSAMSLCDIYQLDSDHFSPDGEEADPKITEIGWIAARKEILPESAYKAMSEQKMLIDEQAGENIPIPAEFVWVITTYWKVKHIHLFEGFFTRTTSTNRMGYNFSIGCDHGRIRTNPNNWAACDKISCLGLQPVRRFLV